MNQRLQILQHSMGLDQYGRGTKYRNHFVAGPGHSDYDCIQGMISEGIMEASRVSKTVLAGGSECFFVTKKGEIFIDEHSPNPPKLSPSKANYQAYRHSELDMSFGDWIKWQQWRKKNPELAKIDDNRIPTWGNEYEPQITTSAKGGK